MKKDIIVGSCGSGGCEAPHEAILPKGIVVVKPVR